MEQNSWVFSGDIPELNKKQKTGSKKKAPVVQPRAAKSNMRALIAAARKKTAFRKGFWVRKNVVLKFFYYNQYKCFTGQN